MSGMGKRNAFAQKLTAAPYLVWLAVFVIVPLVMVAYFAFVGADGKFTLE